MIRWTRSWWLLIGRWRVRHEQVSEVCNMTMNMLGRFERIMRSMYSTGRFEAMRAPVALERRYIIQYHTFTASWVAMGAETHTSSTCSRSLSLSYSSDNQSPLCPPDKLLINAPRQRTTQRLPGNPQPQPIKHTPHPFLPKHHLRRHNHIPIPRGIQL